MQRRFLVHSFDQTVLVVDITSIGLSTEIPLDGQRQDVPTVRFERWKDAEAYLLHAGADLVTLGNARSTIRTGNMAAVVEAGSVPLSPFEANLVHKLRDK